MIRNYQVITIVILMSLLCGQSSFAEVVPSSLDAMVQAALENNPRVKAAYHRWQAEEEGGTVSSSLPDPNVSYGYFFENVETRVGPQEQKFGISQKIPFPGKLRLKGKARSKQAEIFEQQYLAVKNEVIKELKFDYYELLWIDKAIEINEEEGSILERLEKVAQRKYESNLSPQQDVIKAQVELSKTLEKLLLLKQNRNRLVLNINQLLNRSQETPIEKIGEVPPVVFDDSLEALLAKAENSRQELVAANLDVERANYEKKLARLEFLPDVTLSGEYIDVGGGSTAAVNDGDDAYMGKVSVNIPLWFWKQKANLKEKKEQLKAVELEREAVEDRLEYEVKDLYFQMTTYQEIVLLYETALIPQAEQAFESSQTGFETGALSFLDWLDTERTYLQTRLAYFKAITDFYKTKAFLERVIGEPL